MLAVKVEGLSEFSRKLRALAETPEAISRAINYTAADTVDGMHRALDTEVDRVFDNPTPYVKRGLKKRYPTGNARRGFRQPMGADKAGVYYEFFGGGGMSPEAVMKPHVFGGPRRQKSFERRLGQYGGPGWHGIMATSYPRNKYGNISGAKYTQMLTNLGTIETARPGQKRRKNPKTISFWILRKGGNVLVMERRGKKSRPMIYLTTKRPMYDKRYDFFGVGKRMGLRMFKDQFPKKILRELRKL